VTLLLVSTILFPFNSHNSKSQLTPSLSPFFFPSKSLQDQFLSAPSWILEYYHSKCRLTVHLPPAPLQCPKPLHLSCSRLLHVFHLSSIFLSLVVDFHWVLLIIDSIISAQRSLGPNKDPSGILYICSRSSFQVDFDFHKDDRTGEARYPRKS
jgi:hypothetical protein